MDLTLDGKTVMISGGSSGIGLAIANSMAAEGANLSICARNSKALKKVATELEYRYGIQCLTFAGDLTEPKTGDEWVRVTITRFKNIDILINNAATPTAGHFIDLNDSDLRNGLELKLFGYLAMTRSVLPKMRELGKGVIVNIIGAVASQPAAGSVVGGIAGAALASFTKTLSIEMAELGIRVVAVSPGYTATDRYRRTVAQLVQSGLEPEAAEKSICRDIPLGRPATPQEVADLVTYVASDRAAYMVGNTIAIDGGITRGI